MVRSKLHEILSYLTKDGFKKKKKKTFLTKRWRHFEDVPIAETLLFNAKLLISRLASFSVPNLTVIQHV